ncbi:predicted protein [Histoplasma capsulatum G186AR]|uniref:Uncharacterized protein n=1 Tax=Ajellomyces capsulatus (strain G186AR / H82 / ATCC MYA-2454 / RMSCC 2432) TaxID=447093 RepID=C0NX84_AJECG|nr:uncharacterized protein HCBG_08076 [Histoplasma capsulatum G186AR]EEH03950.1 predicted protein [Histoplasma capsulatum G186AR]
MVQDQQSRGVLARMQLASDGYEASCASKVPRGRALEGPRGSLGCAATDIKVETGLAPAPPLSPSRLRLAQYGSPIATRDSAVLLLDAFDFHPTSNLNLNLNVGINSVCSIGGMQCTHQSVPSASLFFVLIVCLALPGVK